MYADLHAHTTASDGSATPTELVRQAAALGLSLLAVTDHDTTGGVAEAMRAAREAGVRLLPGVELSAEGPPGKCHLLGLGIDPGHAGLNAKLEQLSAARRARAARIVERFQALGVDLTLEDVDAATPDGANVGRPHLAKALLQKGAVATMQEAFDRYLADGGPAYVPKMVLPPAEAIALIHDAGGLAFLAHPGLLKLDAGETPRDRLLALRDLGLDGVEAYYSQHTLPQTDRYLDLARDLGLLVTGGSDFHGANKPGVPLGVVTNGHGVPLDALPAILRDWSAGG